MQRQPGKRPASFAAMIDQSQNILLAEISQNCGERHTKTDIVVPVVRVVVVALFHEPPRRPYDLCPDGNSQTCFNHAPSRFPTSFN